MTLRKVLIIPLLVSLLFFILYGGEIWRTALHVLDSLRIDALFIALVIVAVVLQFTGHIVRAKKASLLMDPMEHSKVSTQFRAFSIGQLFNTLLPFRIGELIRSSILSQKLNISFIYSLSLIVFERLIDLLVVVVLVICAVVFLGAWPGWIPAALILLSVTLLGLASLFIYMQQPVWVKRFIYSFSTMFNERIRNVMRFKLWSLAYGLNGSFANVRISRYVGLTALMWVFYLASIFVVATALLGGSDIIQKIIASITPYFGIAVPAGPAGLGRFSEVVAPLSHLTSDTTDIIPFIIIAWAVLVIPISLTGIALLFTNTAEPLWAKRSEAFSDDLLLDKLSRRGDVSGELSVFLENYFSGNDLSRIVDRLERQGEFSLVKYFKGGSDAVTILAIKAKKRVVKKVIAIDLKDRLKAQYDWLKKYSARNNAIVAVGDEKTGEDYYSIDIAYDKTSVPLFEYVHEIALNDAEGLLDETWSALHASLYKNSKKVTKDDAVLEAYIEKHIYSCLEKAMVVDDEIKVATKPATITINGKVYDNLYQVLEKIRTHPKAWADLLQYRESGVVHGDVIMDNLLYSKKDGRVIIIDPAPDGNMVEGPVFDFGKSVQSLHCGYEFLLRDETPVNLIDGDTIAFKETKSTRYADLDSYVMDTIAKKYLTEAERRAALFHGGALYIRRLKHQVYYTPENALKFYAVGVRTLNEYLSQYS